MRRRGPIDGEPDARYWAQAAPFDENGDTSMGGMDPRDLDFAVDDDYGKIVLLSNENLLLKSTMCLLQETAS